MSLNRPQRIAVTLGVLASAVYVGAVAAAPEIDVWLWSSRLGTIEAEAHREGLRFPFAEARAPRISDELNGAPQLIALVREHRGRRMVSRDAIDLWTEGQEPTWLGQVREGLSRPALQVQPMDVAQWRALAEDRRREPPEEFMIAWVGRNLSVAHQTLAAAGRFKEAESLAALLNDLHSKAIAPGSGLGGRCAELTYWYASRVPATLIQFGCESKEGRESARKAIAAMPAPPSAAQLATWAALEAEREAAWGSFTPQELTDQKRAFDIFGRRVEIGTLRPPLGERGERAMRARVVKLAVDWTSAMQQRTNAASTLIQTERQVLDWLKENGPSAWLMRHNRDAWLRAIRDALTQEDRRALLVEALCAVEAGAATAEPGKWQTVTKLRSTLTGQPFLLERDPEGLSFRTEFPAPEAGSTEKGRPTGAVHDWTPAPYVVRLRGPGSGGRP